MNLSLTLSTPRVAALQLPPCTTDLANNEAAAFAAVRTATDDGAQLLVLPELSMVPYFASAPGGQYRDWAEPADGPLAARCATLAKEYGVTLFVPFYEVDPATGRYHNAVLGFGADGKPLRAGSVARKLHLPVGDDPPSATTAASQNAGARCVRPVRISSSFPSRAAGATIWISSSANCAPTHGKMGWRLFAPTRSETNSSMARASTTMASRV
jgi:predicted amidohydrolase